MHDITQNRPTPKTDIKFCRGNAYIQKISIAACIRNVTITRKPLNQALMNLCMYLYIHIHVYARAFISNLAAPQFRSRFVSQTHAAEANPNRCGLAHASRRVLAERVIAASACMLPEHIVPRPETQHGHLTTFGNKQVSAIAGWSFNYLQDLCIAYIHSIFTSR